jgi:predicted O-methyltransferase YrrM
MKPPQFYRMYDYDKAVLRNSHLASLEEGVSNIDQAQKVTGFTIGYPGWGLMYHLLLSHLHPTEFNVVVETGTNQGCTSVMLAQALRDSGRSGKVFTVELNPTYHQKALANFASAQVADLVEPHLGDSREFLKSFAAEHPSVRIAILDASHLYDDVITEFELLYPTLGPQSLVVFDNTFQIAEVGEDLRVHVALKAITNKFGGNLINLEFVSWYTPGVALWQKAPF